MLLRKFSSINVFPGTPKYKKYLPKDLPRNENEEKNLPRLHDKIKFQEAKLIFRLAFLGSFF